MKTKEQNGEVKVVKYQRPNLFELRGKVDPKFVYRYIRDEHIERRIDEGWVIVDGSEAKVLKPARPVTETNRIKIGKLTLMKIPRGLAEDRNEYFRTLNDTAIRGQVDKLKEQGEKDGIEVLEGEEAFVSSNK